MQEMSHSNDTVVTACRTDAPEASLDEIIRHGCPKTRFLSLFIPLPKAGGTGAASDY